MMLIHERRPSVTFKEARSVMPRNPQPRYLTLTRDLQWMHSGQFLSRKADLL